MSPRSAWGEGGEEEKDRGWTEEDGIEMLVAPRMEGEDEGGHGGDHLLLGASTSGRTMDRRALSGGEEEEERRRKESEGAAALLRAAEVRAGESREEAAMRLRKMWKNAMRETMVIRRESSEGPASPRERTSAVDHAKSMLTDIKEEQEGERQARAWTIHPENRWYQLWWHALIVAVILSCILTPFRYAFWVYDPTQNGFEALQTVGNVETGLDVMFGVDICINFFLAYYDSVGHLVRDPAKIVRHYLQYRFWVDLISTAPIDYGIADTDSSPTARALRAMGLLRCIRVWRILELLARLEEDTRLDYFYVACTKYAYIAITLGHWAGCALYWAASLNNFDENTWTYGNQVNELPLGERYLVSIYFAFITMTTVGYGDYSAVSTVETSILIVFVLLNFGLSAYILGSLTMLTTASDVDAFDFRQRIHKLESFFERNNVPESIKLELRQFMQLHFDTTEHRGDVLSGFPQSVKLPLHRFLYLRTMEVVPVLKGVSKEFRERLITEATVEFFLAGMSLVHTGDVDTGFFIILDGQVEMFMEGALGEEDEVVLYATKGQAIGKESIVTGMAHPYGIRARTLVRTLYISIDGYRKACAEKPGDKVTVQRNLLVFCKRHLDMMHGRKSVRTMRQMDHIIHTLEKVIQYSSLVSAHDLCHAVACGDTEEIFHMAGAGVDMTTADWDGRTPLHVAAITGNAHIARMLLRHSADPNAVDQRGCTPTLHAAESNPERNTVLKYLLRAGGTLDKAGGASRDTVFAHAVRAIRTGQNRVVYRMLEAGMDPSLADNSNRTLLHVAAFAGNEEACRLLIACGADPSIKSVGGSVPADEAKDGQVRAVVQNTPRGDVDAAIEDLVPFEEVEDAVHLKPQADSGRASGIHESHRLKNKQRGMRTLLPHAPARSLTAREREQVDEEVAVFAESHATLSRAFEEGDSLVEDVEGSQFKASARHLPEAQ